MVCTKGEGRGDAFHQEKKRRGYTHKNEKIKRKADFPRDKKRILRHGVVYFVPVSYVDFHIFPCVLDFPYVDISDLPFPLLGNE